MTSQSRAIRYRDEALRATITQDSDWHHFFEVVVGFASYRVLEYSACC